MLGVYLKTSISVHFWAAGYGLSELGSAEASSSSITVQDNFDFDQAQLEWALQVIFANPGLMAQPSWGSFA